VASRGPTYETLRGELARGTVRTAYVLYGEEDLLLDEALDAIVAAALAGADRGFNLDIMRGVEADGRDIVARASSFPMMADRRVVVVRDADKLTGRDPELLASYVERPSPTTCLVLAGTKPDFRRKPFVTIRKEGGAFEFRPLQEDALVSWIIGQVAAGGRRIAPAAASLLTASSGSSLRDLRNEIDKLFIFAGDRKDIMQDDVSAVAGMSREYSIFELQKAIGTRRTPRAVAIMERMLEAGEKVPVIIASLTTYFTTLWKLADLRRRGVPGGEHAAAAHVSPYFIREYYEALEHVTAADCERAILSLAEADETSKTTGQDIRHVMLSLILGLCGEAGGAGGPASRNIATGARV
jgi:DNA polymerase-3 subunit delta